MNQSFDMYSNNFRRFNRIPDIPKVQESIVPTSLSDRLHNIESRIVHFDDVSRNALQELDTLRLEYGVLNQNLDKNLTQTNSELSSLKQNQTTTYQALENLDFKIKELNMETMKIRNNLHGMDESGRIRKSSSFDQESNNDASIRLTNISRKIDSLKLNQFEVENNHQRVDRELFILKNQLENRIEENRQLVKMIGEIDELSVGTTKQIEAPPIIQSSQPDISHITNLDVYLEFENRAEELRQNLSQEKQSRIKLEKNARNQLDDCSRIISGFSKFNVQKVPSSDKIFQIRSDWSNEFDRMADKIDREMDDKLEKFEKESFSAYTRKFEKMKKEMKAQQEQDSQVIQDDLLKKCQNMLKEDSNRMAKYVQDNNRELKKSLKTVNKKTELFDKVIDEVIFDNKKQIQDESKSRFTGFQKRDKQIDKLDSKIASFQNHFEDEIHKITHINELFEQKKITNLLKVILDEEIQKTKQELDTKLQSSIESVNGAEEKRKVDVNNELVRLEKTIDSVYEKLLGELKLIEENRKLSAPEIDTMKQFISGHVEEVTELKDNQTIKQDLETLLKESDKTSKEIQELKKTLDSINADVEKVANCAVEPEKIQKTFKTLAESIYVLRILIISKSNTTTKKFDKDLKILKNDFGLFRDLLEEIFQLCNMRVYIKPISVSFDNNDVMNCWSISNTHKWIKIKENLLKWKEKSTKK